METYLTGRDLPGQTAPNKWLGLRRYPVIHPDRRSDRNHEQFAKNERGKWLLKLQAVRQFPKYPIAPAQFRSPARRSTKDTAGTASVKSGRRPDDLWKPKRRPQDQPRQVIARDQGTCRPLVQGVLARSHVTPNLLLDQRPRHVGRQRSIHSREQGITVISQSTSRYKRLPVEPQRPVTQRTGYRFSADSSRLSHQAKVAKFATGSSLRTPISSQLSKPWRPEPRLSRTSRNQ